MKIGEFDLTRLIEKFMELVSTWGLKVIAGVAVLVVGWLMARSVRSGALKALERAKVDVTLSIFISKICYYLLLTLVVIAVLNLFGIQTASLIAIVGAAGLAIGLALQGTLTNFASGVMLLLFRPFKVGDYIDAAGVAGTVKEIGLFSTLLNTLDNVRIVTPNSAIQGGTIRNYSTNAERRIDLVIGIGYQDDIQVAMDAIEGIIKADKRVLAQPETEIAVLELGDSSVNLLVRPWCSKEEYWGLRCDLIREIKVGLEKAGCSIPFPQMDVHLQKEA